MDIELKLNSTAEVSEKLQKIIRPSNLPVALLLSMPHRLSSA